mmetsp:Transcript_17215/g.25636  ORF Transcript_17215/g.25636 Transcript_17215/m.25636 type:complete len:148 (+) Transcript_17215:111-554(+)
MKKRTHHSLLRIHQIEWRTGLNGICQLIQTNRTNNTTKLMIRNYINVDMHTKDEKRYFAAIPFPITMNISRWSQRKNQSFTETGFISFFCTPLYSSRYMNVQPPSHNAATASSVPSADNSTVCPKLIEVLDSFRSPPNCFHFKSSSK